MDLHCPLEAANAMWLTSPQGAAQSAEQGCNDCAAKEGLQATIGTPAKQIEVLTAGLQKIDAQLELSKPRASKRF